mmetsp:Transcript_782/g.1187  ORF Transcript_782/g.1187 Transcript_782/m.1187 type:complete len:110 (+) Transcript_782:149-478(+)
MLECTVSAIGAGHKRGNPSAVVIDSDVASFLLEQWKMEQLPAYRDIPGSVKTQKGGRGREVSIPAYIIWKSSAVPLPTILEAKELVSSSKSRFDGCFETSIADKERVVG